jgi:uncharacterized membrane protein
MDLRIALYDIAATHGLDATATERLKRLAGLRDAPVDLARQLARGVAVLAAALGGLGVIFWVAANWDTLGRAGRFGLLQALVVVLCLGALWRSAARAPLGLLALLGIGGLFAYFGQTYQTGADAWQLFALWAVLALPLCLGVRSDALWTPWALIAVIAMALWVQTHTGRRWQFEPQHLRIYLLGWGGMLALVAALSSMFTRFTGAGVWAWRTALTLAVVSITASALITLFGTRVAPLYALALAVLATAAAAMVWRRTFEVYGLSAVALGLNTLLVAGLARWLLWDESGEFIGKLVVIGLSAAALLAASVAGVLRLSRRYAPDQTPRAATVPGTFL